MKAIFKIMGLSLFISIMGFSLLMQSVIGVQLITDDQDYQNLYQILNLKDLTGKANSVKEMMLIRSVKGFGAVGDGIADDTAAIQNLINGMPDGGGVIYFPDGTYLISSSLQIAARANINLIGSGGASIIKTNNTIEMIQFINSAYCSMRNLHLVGKYAGPEGNNGVKINNCTDSEVSNCEIEKMGTLGIVVYNGATRNRFFSNSLHDNLDEGMLIMSPCNIVSENRVYNNKSNGIDFNGEYNIITNNIIQNNGLNQTQDGDDYGIDLTGNIGGACRFNTVTGNIVRWNRGGGIVVNNSSNPNRSNVISGNIIYGNGGSRPGQGIVGHGIEIVSDQQNGVPVDGSAFHTIEGNDIQANLGSGIYTSGIGTNPGSNGNIISGNQIRGNGRWGIERVNPAGNDIIAENFIYGNSLGNISSLSSVIYGLNGGEPDLSANFGGYKTNFGFMKSNIPASQTNLAIDVLGLITNKYITLPYAGSIIGISVAANADPTAGTLTVKPSINGVPASLSTTLTGPQKYNSATQTKDTETFVAGNQLGVSITTTSNWAPTSNDIAVYVVVEY